MSIDQIFDSHITDFEYSDNEFSFNISTDVTNVQEQSLTNPSLYKDSGLVSLTINPESYKRHILNPVNFANELRIAILDNVETIAIDSVEFNINTTFIYDETLEIRLRLIPLAMITPSLIWEVWRTDEYATNASIDVTAYSDNFNVTAHMIQFDDPRIKVIPRTLIITLAKGQRLKCNMTISKGIGQVANKYSPVSTVGYRIVNNRTVKISPKLKYKLPALYTLLYALTYLENKYPLFKYDINGEGRRLVIDDDGGVSIA